MILHEISDLTGAIALFSLFVLVALQNREILKNRKMIYGLGKTVTELYVKAYEKTHIS